MCKIGHKLIVIVTVLIALAAALLVTLWHEQGLVYIVFISRFFDIMLPVLAVGALLKYLFTCPYHHRCNCGDNCSCKSEDDKCCCDSEPKVARKGRPKKNPA